MGKHSDILMSLARDKQKNVHVCIYRICQMLAFGAGAVPLQSATLCHGQRCILQNGFSGTRVLSCRC